MTDAIHAARTRAILRAILLATLVAAGSSMAAAQTVSYFPQIADGTSGSLFFKTTIFVANAASSGSVDVTFTFTKSDGTAFNIAFVDENSQPVGSGNSVTISSLAAGQSRKLVSTAAQSLTVGFATISSTGAVSASAVFSQFSGTPASGTLVSEAAVLPASILTNQAIFVDESGAFRTAVAYANPSTTQMATINLNLLNVQGQQVMTTVRTLMMNQHTSAFVDEIFTASPVDGHVGTMQLVSSTAIASVALRFEGSIFTSVPPFSLASLVQPLKAWTEPVGSWLEHRPWLSPLASLARLVGSLRLGRG